MACLETQTQWLRSIQVCSPSPLSPPMPLYLLSKSHALLFLQTRLLGTRLVAGLVEHSLSFYVAPSMCFVGSELIEEGDVIMSIDGIQCCGISAQDLTALIRGTSLFKCDIKDGLQQIILPC